LSLNGPSWSRISVTGGSQFAPPSSERATRTALALGDPPSPVVMPICQATPDGPIATHGSLARR